MTSLTQFPLTNFYKNLKMCINRCFKSKYESPALCVVVVCTVSCATHYFLGKKHNLVYN